MRIKKEFIVLLICSISFITVTTDKIIYRTSFEQDTDFKKYFSFEKCCENSIMLSNITSRKGRYCLKFSLDKSDSLVNNGIRSEIKWTTEKKLNVERWYAFSILLPRGFVADSSAEILAQWHAVPDFILGETWRVPPISLQVEKGIWFVVIHWASSELNDNKSISGSKRIYIKSVKVDNWEDFIFHIKFSYKSDGLLELWDNNNKVFSYSGPNCYNDKSGIFFKTGIYKWAWRSDWAGEKSILKHRTIYLDDLAFGSEDCQLLDLIKK